MTDTGRRRRGWQLSALFLSVALVLGATLMPLGDEVRHLPAWCLFCGELAVLDLLQNVALFFPLGAALFALGMSQRGALAVGLALTVAVEALQFTTIPGRDASLGDIITNFVGAYLGFRVAERWRMLLFPAKRTARILAIAYLGVWTLVMVGTGIAMQARVPNYGYWSQWTPVRKGTLPFPGQLLGVRVSGIPLPPGVPLRAESLRAAVRAPDSRLELDVRPGNPPPRQALIARVASPFGTAIATAQLGRRFECQRYLRASKMRLRVPWMTLDRAFPESVPEGTTGEIYRFACAWEDGRLTAARLAPGAPMARRVMLSLGEGWLLLAPIAVPLGTAALAGSISWLLALSFPAGYVLARALPGGTRRSIAIVALLWTLVTAIVFVTVPLLAGILVPAISHWLASIGGGIAGAATSTRVREPPGLDHAEA